MAKQSIKQKIGAIGHKWALLQIESHRDWLSRDLSEDFGIDAEAELIQHGINGEILKIQFKSSEFIEISEGKVRFFIDKKYLDYAKVCRYPVVLVYIDITAKKAWYLWLQDWLLEQRRKSHSIDSKQKQFTTWVDASQTLANGLDEALKDIARWRGNTQLVLSLLDAMRAATATRSEDVIDAIIELIVAAAPDIADTTLDIILEEAILLGDRMRGSLEGLHVGTQLFKLVRRFGDRTSANSIERMVRRDATYSRTGLTALGILYDNFFEHTKALTLAEMFLRMGLPHVGYYCALREQNPNQKSLDFLFGPGEFCFAGLGFQEPPNFMNDYANRGPSAILDYLVPISIE